MSTTTDTLGLAAPRAPRSTPSGRVNWEKWGWIYMRASGVILVVLIFGHLFVNLMLGDGIKGIDFAFVGGKYATPFWQIWDTAMLWLALIHGANGMRTLVNDYATHIVTQRVLKGALLFSVITLLTLGTLVIYTFDPCPAGAPADLLASFCATI
jgi:succinate dehydrogenase / fumarate reductase membrane anchor subunit